jgi:prepilin-type N-terminal cleavage/methylation domain-containing protein
MKKSNAGFTLIEMIGVLAIIAIIASAIVPNIAREVTRAIADAEDMELRSLEDAFLQYISESKSISGVATGQWNVDIAPYLSIPSAKIVTNKGSGTRRLIVRPTNGLGAFPYSQATRFLAGVTPQGTLPTAAPLQARFLFVSNLSGNAPVTNLTDVQFDAVWDQTGTIPAGFTENEKLRLNRIGLVKNFYPVTISCSGIASTPRWSLDAAAAKSLNVGTFTVYLLQGTRINMFLGASAVGTIVVTKPLGITSDGTTWSY